MRASTLRAYVHAFDAGGAGSESRNLALAIAAILAAWQVTASHASPANKVHSPT